MGHNIAYVYIDIDNSFERIRKEFNFEETSYCIEILLNDKSSSTLIFTKDGSFIEALTNIKPIYPYDFNNPNLKVYDDFLKSRIKSKIYKIDSILLNIWGDIQPLDWEDDDEKVKEFFKWLQIQDENYWGIVR